MLVSMLETFLLVMTVVGLSITVFVLRPMVARARVGHEARLIEYRLMDAMLDGEIEVNDPALEELVSYSRLLSERARQIGITEATAMLNAARQCGISLRDVVPPRSSHAQMSPEGRKIAMAAEGELHALFARYLLHGSKAWFLIGTAQAVLRFARKHGSVPRPRAGWPTSPNAAATGYRALVHNERVRPLVDAGPLALA